MVELSFKLYSYVRVYIGEGRSEGTIFSSRRIFQ